VSDKFELDTRIVKAVHSWREATPEPDFEIGFADHLRVQYSRDSLIDLYAHFAVGAGNFD